MKASIVIALTKINQSITYFTDFKRQTKAGIGERVANKYIEKLNWILTDFKTNINFSDAVRESVRLELASDDHQADAIYDKFMLLDETKRQLVEELTDALLKGEEIKIVDTKNKY